MTKSADRWTDVGTYLAEDPLGHREHLAAAQFRDVDGHVGLVSSVEVRTSRTGEEPYVQMVLNRGLESEETLRLSPVQVKRILPVLIFEAREAIRGLEPDLCLHPGSQRCPECGLGPYGMHTRVASVLARLRSSKTRDAAYAVYDESIAPVFDWVPAGLRRQVVDALEARRTEFDSRK